MARRSSTASLESLFGGAPASSGGGRGFHYKGKYIVETVLVVAATCLMALTYIPGYFALLALVWAASLLAGWFGTTQGVILGAAIVVCGFFGIRGLKDKSLDRRDIVCWGLIPLLIVAGATGLFGGGGARAVGMVQHSVLTLFSHILGG